MRIKGVALALATVVTTTALGANAMDADAIATRRSIGMTIASIGVATFAGAVFLGRERMPNDNARCAVDVCPSMATLIVADARSQSDSAFRLMALGAFAMASGVSLYLTSDTTKRRSDAEVGLAPGGIFFKTYF
jgi:hypothetical protein